MIRTTCIACKSNYYYDEEDGDTSQFVCSHCFNGNLMGHHDSWARIRFKILKRDNFKCVYCGDSPRININCVLNVDHIKPVSKGGHNGEKNLITSCGLCNGGKFGTELEKEYVVDLNRLILDREKELNENYDRKTT